MRSRHSVRLLVVSTVAAIGLTACGGDAGSSSSGVPVQETNLDDVARSASADGTSCPEKTSSAFRGHIMNGLPRDISLSVPRNEWTCYDWSGVSTPGHVLDGMYLVSGARHQFRLEVAGNAPFTLGFDGQWMENFTETLVSGNIDSESSANPGAWRVTSMFSMPGSRA
jgi:hypothetical protein